MEQHIDEWYRELFASNPLPMWIYDPDTLAFLDVNPAATTLYGYSREEFLAMTTLDIRPAEEIPALLRQIQITLSSPDAGFQKDGLWRHRSRAGQLLCVETARHLISFQGKQAICVIVNDITERWQKEAALQKSEARYRAIVETAEEGIWMLGPDNRITFSNRKIMEMLGYSGAAMQGRPVSDFQDEENRALTTHLLDRLRAGSQAQADLQFQRQDGASLWTIASARPNFDAAGRYMGCLVMLTNITERKKSEKMVRYMTTHDPLTRLPNRALLQDRLNQAILHAHRLNRRVAVLFLDLDRFKLVNDSLGHDKGDLLLLEMAHRLSQVLREGDTVARVGGDEFVVVLGDLDSVEEIVRIADRLMEEVARPVRLKGHELVLATSLGISCYPKDAETATALIKNSDLAMYQAKSKGGGRYRFYAEEMNTRLMERLLMENGLRRALEKGEFVVHYQPRVDLRSGSIAGMEALVRWQHPDRGIIYPDEFIALAEEIGLIVPIGEHVLRIACEQHQRWQQMGLAKTLLSVNLSACQLANAELVDRIEAILEETGLDPSLLEFEITESGLMQDIDAARELLLKLTRLGVSLSVDDFGTGYSSLSYLKRLPIQTLKVDRSFVQDLATDTDDASIVTATIAMAHNMHLRVVAEGVQTQDQLAFLSSRQCDEMQGFLFSFPLPAGGMETLMRENRQLQMPAAG